MAVTAEMRRDGEHGSTDRWTIPYLVTGTADRREAMDAIEADAPGTVSVATGKDDLVFKQAQAEAQFVDVGDPDSCIWDGEAQYTTREKQPVSNSHVWRFDISGETQNLVAPISRRAVYEVNESGYQEKVTDGRYDDVLINNGDGVDITVSVLSWTETHYLPPAYVSWRDFGRLYNLRGNVNEHQFRVFSQGEVLFKHLTGGYQEGDDYFELNYTFEAAPNRTAVQIRPFSGIAKHGHDYLWVETETKEVNGDKETVPKRVYVDQVFEYVDFSDMPMDQV